MTVDQLQPLRANELVTKVTSTPSNPELMAVNDHTDHMIEVDWNSVTGWGVPHLKPWAPLQLDPTASVLHYSTTCFEGMKAYKSADGKKVQMFRPSANINRLNDSAARICLPTVEVDQAIILLEKFLELEQRFIKPGHYIYMRPLLMGTEPSLGFKTAQQAKFMVMATLYPVLNNKPLSLYCSPPDSIRAWPGGFGYAKLGANYAPTLKANTDCINAGYSQVLWLLGDNGVVTEAGTSNFFVAMKNEQGKVEVLTCPLSTGVVLPGVTRRSVLEVLQNKFGNEVTVEEREFTIADIEKAAAENRLLEAFSVGTAYFIAPVQAIRMPNGKRLEIPLGEHDGMFGDFSAYAKQFLGDIMWGNVDHEWAHNVQF